VTAVNVNNKPKISPDYFQYKISPSNKTMRNVVRDLHTNHFFYNPRTYNGRKKEVPFITSQEIFAELAGKELSKDVIPSSEPLPPLHFVLKGTSTVPLYREMLRESDNFISEQLLLMVSDELFKEMNTGKAIDYVLKNYLFDLPDAPQWVDGSGL